jgi:hypothetical protein
MSDFERMQTEQRVAGDVLSLAAALGFACPPVFIGQARAAAQAMRREQAAGQAAAVSSAVTTALAAERRGLRCGGGVLGLDARVFHGADCATSIGCGKGITG